MKIGGKIAVVIAAAAVATLTGCSKHKEPPFERMELVSRFFDSVRKQDFETAARQGQKLYAMDRNNEFLLHLITIHESNVFLRQAQKELNSGNVDGALKVLSDGSRRYPDNRTLRMYHTRIIQLRNAKSLLAAMKTARGEAAMSAALTAAETGLGTNMSKKLNKYFKDYEARIEAERKSEKEKLRIDGLGDRNVSAPSGPKAGKPASRTGRPGGKGKGVTPPKEPESLARPAPIAVPESENVQ